MRALSLDLLERIVAAYDRGDRTQREVAELFSVSEFTVRKLLRQRRETGNLAPRYGRTGGRRKILAEHQEKLREILAQRPDMTLEQMRDTLELDCTIQAIHYALLRMGYSYKKTLRASEQDREDVAIAREAWRRRQGKLDPSNLVFIDESGAKTNMTRLRGRAPRGRRLNAQAPSGRWESTTMISSVRLDGSTACMTIGGATNSEIFRAYVAEILLPTLREGDLVVMDNLSAHKNAETIALIESVGAKAVFLPPYSPDLNPIEMMWSKVKSILRSVEPS